MVTIVQQNAKVTLIYETLRRILRQIMIPEPHTSSFYFSPKKL